MHGCLVSWGDTEGRHPDMRGIVSIPPTRGDGSVRVHVEDIDMVGGPGDSREWGAVSGRVGSGYRELQRPCPKRIRAIPPSGSDRARLVRIERIDMIRGARRERTGDRERVRPRS